MADLALVIEGGAMRNAFTTAVLADWHERGFTAQGLDAIYASSSGAPVGVYFAADDPRRMERIWIDEMTRWDVYNPLNFLLREPCADIHGVIETICADLDLTSLDRLRTRIMVSTVRRRDGLPQYHRCDSRNTLRLLTATCALPLVTDWVELDGEIVVDGGLWDPLPVLKAYEDGYRDLVVLTNAPRTERPLHRWEKALSNTVFDAYPEMRQRVLAMPAHYERTMRFIASPPADAPIFTVGPQNQLKSTRFTRSRRKVETDIRYGRKVGRRSWEPLREFLSQ